MNITKQSIIKAIEKIDQSPELKKGRHSIEYDLVFNGKNYPPILVLSEANKFTGGNELFLSDFQNSTTRAFTILRDLGFTIIRKGDMITELLKKFISQSKTNDLT